MTPESDPKSPRDEDATPPGAPTGREDPVDPDATTILGMPPARQGGSETRRTIGGYPILGELGRGGMGIVHVAEDPRLQRRIALKLLPQNLSERTGAFEDLQREARLLAQMNHPNIATIHSLEETDDGMFLTMELVEGETLDTRLRRGPLPLDEFLGVIRQVSTALDAAHRQLVVHRDLKPQNIMVTPDGLVKVLDFGLAVALPRAADGESPSGVRAEAAGTPGYMSPEQIRGDKSDGRTDLFALGCIMFECLTQQRAFPGDTIADRLRATLNESPDLGLLPAWVPQRLRTMLESCLAKPVDERVASATEVRRLIEDTISHQSLRAAAAARGPRDDTTPNNLPLRLARFVGRTRELEEVTRLLEDNRLVTLTGIGGGGKTRLAIEAASKLTARAPDGIWFVELAATENESAVLRALADVLGVDGDPKPTLADAVHARLATHHALLVLDNCEHVIDGVRSVATRLLASCPDLRLIATSRQPIGLPGEAVFHVPSLGMPPEGRRQSLTELRNIESIMLFVERAKAARPEFDVDETNRDAIARICRQLDGIPLAIELAAARVRVLVPEEISARLENRFRLLSSTIRGGEQRHRTLRATIDWSYDNLEPQEQLLLERLSVFSGGATLEAAEKICAGEEIEDWEVLDQITSLVDKSLVQVDAEGGLATGKARFRLLETVRLYAREKLVDRGDPAVYWARHLEHFASLAADAEQALTGPEQAEWLTRLSTEHANFERALTRAIDGRLDIEGGIALAASLGRYWHMRGHWQEARATYDRMLPQLERVRSAASATALRWAGNLAKLQRDDAPARELLEKSLETSREIEDLNGVASALNDLGHVIRDGGDTATARELYTESLETHRRLENDAGVALALNSLAVLAQIEGDLVEARRLYGKSIDIGRRLGDTAGVAATLINLGVVFESLDENEKSSFCFEESLEIFREQENRWGVAATLVNLGRVIQKRGDHARASEAYEESLAIFRDLGDRRSVAATLYKLGSLAQALGEHPRATRLFRESLTIFRDLDSSAEIEMLLTSLAESAAALEDPKRAATLLGAAESLREEAGISLDARGRTAIDRSLASLSQALGDDELSGALEGGRSLSRERAIREALDGM